MSIKADDPREELFWWANILTSGFIYAVCYWVLHSARLLPGISSHQTVASLCRLGVYFLLAYGAMFFLQYFLRGNWSRIRTGCFLLLTGEAMLICYRMFFTMRPVEGGAVLMLLAGNAIALLEILLHERRFV